jgi:hypothetical protein
MRRRVHQGVLVTTVLLGLVVLPVFGQTEAIDLTLKIAQGETLYYAETGSMQVTLEMVGTKRTVDGRYEARPVYRILALDSDGVALVETVLESTRITMGGKTEQLEDTPWTFRVRPDGRIVEKILGAADIDFDDFPFPLPDHPVTVGESWSRQTKLTRGGISGQGAGTFTLAAVDQVAAGRIARVRYQVDGTLADAETSALPSGVQGRGTVRATGEYVWSMDRGRPVQATTEMTVDVQVEGAVQGQAVRLRMGVKLTDLMESLAAESVTIPQVSPDLQIVPGKGFGTFTLETPVPDLTTRLGPPDFGENLGFRAPSLLWRDRLVGYVDENDRDKLVGLETTDRRYRTEKGIGVGSTQGAVLFAHGMSPVKIEMSIPRHGNVRMLIYNDQGIAFAIATDKHTGGGSWHAPIGAVDWIVVFPAGGAGRIFPIP